MKKWFGKVVSRLYWKYGRRYDDNSFWARVVVYHVPEDIDGKTVIGYINGVTGDISYRGEIYHSSFEHEPYKPRPKGPFKSMTFK